MTRTPIVVEKEAELGLRWKCTPLTVGGVTVLLRQMTGQRARIVRAILLIPGANSSCDTFRIPYGGLAAHLAELGFDVWMLDWRPSPLSLALTQRPVGGSPEKDREAYTLDRMVREDLPAALSVVRGKIKDLPLTVHGHCVGGGGVATAIARGYLQDFAIDRVVLSTLALFYEVPWNTWIKAEDFLLERLLLPGKDPPPESIDPEPGQKWPDAFQKAYDRWPKAWQPPDTPAREDQFLRRLSFMVGQPYTRDRIEPSIDGDPILSCFGELPMGLYLHLGAMVRRGYSDQYLARDVVDRSRLIHGFKTKKAPQKDFNREFFRGRTVTVVAAGDNGVWHRDSIDLMYEWLRREPRRNPPDPRHEVRCEKIVFPGYNIQELYWGKDAPKETYDAFAWAAGAPVPRPARFCFS